MRFRSCHWLSVLVLTGVMTKPVLADPLEGRTTSAYFEPASETLLLRVWGDSYNLGYRVADYLCDQAWIPCRSPERTRLARQDRR